MKRCFVQRYLINPLVTVSGVTDPRYCTYSKFKNSVKLDYNMITESQPLLRQHLSGHVSLKKLTDDLVNMVR